MKNKLLTFAVPTYNMEKYLACCLDSIVCDNMDYLEVLVVNDGSKDRSSEIGHQYETKYPNVIRVIDKENGNYGSCVNCALAEAQGKYFRMLDADDWCDTDALNQWIENLKTCDADMVLTISEDRGEKGELIRRLEAPDSVVANKVYAIDQFDGVELEYNSLYCSHIVTYKTKILQSMNLQLQVGISYTDNEYVFYPLDKVESVVYYALPIYQYFVGREGQTTDPKVMNNSLIPLMQVFDGLWQYYILHRDMEKQAVVNNQRIMLLEMTMWIYRACFCSGNYPALKIMEERLKNETYINEQVHKRPLVRYGIDILDYYHQTGRFVNHPITKLKLTYHRVLRFVSRMIKNS